MDSLLPLLNEIVEANNDKIAKYGDMILYTCIEYDQMNFIEFVERICLLN